MISFTSADLVNQPYCFEVGKEICLHSQDSGISDVSRLGKVCRPSIKERPKQLP
jgi:hypothetical protein